MIIIIAPQLTIDSLNLYKLHKLTNLAVSLSRILISRNKEIMTTQFSDKVYTSTKQDPLQYLRYYKNVEPHDKNKLYEKFTEGEYLYVPKLYTFGRDTEYVAYGIDLTEEQSDRLGQFCECAIDKMYSFNPAKYFACKCCAGCVKSMDMASQEFIVKAIEKEKAKLEAHSEDMKSKL